MADIDCCLEHVRISLSTQAALMLQMHRPSCLFHFPGTTTAQQQLVIEGQNMLKCLSAPVCNGCMNTIFSNCQLSFQNRNDQFVGCVIWSKVKVWVKTIVMHWTVALSQWTHHTHCKYWNIVHIQHYQWHQLQLISIKSTLPNQTFISFHFTPRLF